MEKSSHSRSEYYTTNLDLDLLRFASILALICSITPTVHLLLPSISLSLALKDYNGACLAASISSKGGRSYSSMAICGTEAAAGAEEAAAAAAEVITAR